MDAGGRRTPGWAALLIALAVLGLALFGGAALYRAIPAPDAARLGDYGAAVLDRLLQDACIIGPLYVAAILMLRGIERRHSPSPSVAPTAATTLGAGLGAGFFLLALALVGAFGGLVRGSEPPALPHRLLGVLVGGLLILFQAGGEEYFFRGWLQPVLAARWGPWVGLVVASLLFGAAHAVVQRVGVVAFVNDCLAGAAFGLFALRTGGLFAPVAAHWGWNWAEQSLAGATPNPGVDMLGSLFDVDLKGPGLLSGGADEMNGSLCATAALLALIACAALVRPRRPAV